MASHEGQSNESQLNGDYPMKKCKSSNIALHLYEPVPNNSILRAEVTKRSEMSIGTFRSHVVF